MDTCPELDYNVEDVVSPEGEIVDIAARPYCNYYETEDFCCDYCSRRYGPPKKNYFDREREDYTDGYLDG